ncbi:hypothetical protein Blon_1676 [Bifidobacterium longum subsp. infantis ATCC 15697 = JCM 1222 = DSM 20088]|uniref:Uncharacterized protein n=1 Tax=Bifidobacterium longum subsp. infantis (strain ATCC 15697 / DSM 20088 / JCM 1222 / NCTC 11817 / S12) TaxID=391904 RepID=B7GSS2_BIFLS|nr:hypothetical protein Blon_1676 [Bifidobacterium longum subsp. infantis ATCC 15697 = JCM 1222 = DSM 20088]
MTACLFMFQSGCVMDKCGMKAVSESKSDCFAHRRIPYLGRLAGPHPPRRVRQSTPMSPIGEIVNGRRRITTPWHGGSAWRLGMAARPGARHHARVLGEPSGRPRSADLRPQHLGRHPPARGGLTPGRLIQ